MWWGTRQNKETGSSILMITIVIMVVVGGIGYVATDLLPRLGSAVNKSKTVLNYKIFISSLNDYVVHGVRERWCLDTIEVKNEKTEDGTMENVALTNLLISNDCSTSKTMEEIVTYPANLERILWDRNVTIGSTVYSPASPPNPTEVNTIMALNYMNLQAGKTTNKLKPEDVELPNGRMRLRIPQSALQDMNDQHPLFSVAQSARECIEKIDIVLEREKDLNNIPAGDEKKFSVEVVFSLKGGISSRCSTVRHVKSKAFYAFYPRRNHTFALIKYGDLDAGLFADYHGPVYVAGDLVLPPKGTNRGRTSVFMDTLTLGVYDGGMFSPGVRKAGRIVSADGSGYTFADRGHPFKGKQSYYDEFRGLKGGLRLDAEEDKGLVNLFDYTSSSSVDVAKLEACVDEQKFLTTPSHNHDSKFAFKRLNNSYGSDLVLGLAFSKRNRFKEQYYGHRLMAGTNQGAPFLDYQMSEPAGSDVKASIRMEVDTPKDGRMYSAALGLGSKINLNLDLEKFGTSMDRAGKIEGQLASVDRHNWGKIFTVEDAFKQLDSAREYLEAAHNFMRSCEQNMRSVCRNYGFEGEVCEGDCPHYSDVSLKSAIGKARNDVAKIKGILARPEEASLQFEIEKEFSGTYQVLNQAKLKISPNQKLQQILPYIDFEHVDLRLLPEHYGKNEYELKIRIQPSSSNKSQLSYAWVEPGEDGGGLPFFNKGKENHPYNPGPKVEPLQSSGPWRNALSHDQLGSNEIKKVMELDCPEGVGIASWGLDMSASANFAWNYANTPPGAAITDVNHDPFPKLVFELGSNGERLVGYGENLTMSIVKDCVVEPEREFIYGFYVCENLRIKSGRAKDLRMIGTFVVRNLQVEEKARKVHWHNIWDDYAADMILTDLNEENAICDGITEKTWKDVAASEELNARMSVCSPQNMVQQGPNNFTWTTIDPDIGIANPGDPMTSQKVKRIRNYIVQELSRMDFVR